LSNSPPRVLYYAGCLIQRFFPEIGHSSVNVLRKNKVEVIVKEEKCCGIPALASGFGEGARKLARWNINSFLQEEVEAIVTSCPSCGMVFKEYPWLFRKEGGNFSRRPSISVKESMILQIFWPIKSNLLLPGGTSRKG
jgi:glycolate oxidase iron-sulfur subunit